MGKALHDSLIGPIRAAIYCRISRDKEGGGLGVERQETECRALAERLGWEVVALYTDNDISAYSGKHRPQYRAMLDAVQRGEVTAILAWHTDRLHRRAMELEEFVVVAEAHHVQVQTVPSREIDLTTPSGRLVARQLGSVAQYEVEQTRKRLWAQKAQPAADGKYRGGPTPLLRQLRLYLAGVCPLYVVRGATGDPRRGPLGLCYSE